MLIFLLFEEDDDDATDKDCFFPRTDCYSSSPERFRFLLVRFLLLFQSSSSDFHQLEICLEMKTSFFIDRYQISDQAEVVP
jgi:hypothetical protein